jgi:2-polyprenyl-3-methyl-5-hydroxy-6-metoxy-1,4-benzoquinol methylase
MQRELEPEVMDTPDEAVAYDQMDHCEVNRRFVDDLLAAWEPIQGPVEVVDLGTGTALIPIELCRRDARVHVVAVDAAEHMLEVARANVERAGLADRIRLELADAKQPSAGTYDVVMSNSLVHHLPEPAMFFDRAAELVRPGGMLFVRDLYRPASEAEWQRLVDLYTAGESDHARQMFAESLRAALTVHEVRELVAARGFDPASVTATSDRHWTWVAWGS